MKSVLYLSLALSMTVPRIVFSETLQCSSFDKGHTMIYEKGKIEQSDDSMGTGGIVFKRDGDKNITLNFGDSTGRQFIEPLIKVGAFSGQDFYVGAMNNAPTLVSYFNDSGVLLLSQQSSFYPIRPDIIRTKTLFSQCNKEP